MTGVFDVHSNVDDGDGWTSAGRSFHPGLFGILRSTGASALYSVAAPYPGQATNRPIDHMFEGLARPITAPPSKLYADATGGVGVRAPTWIRRAQQVPG